MRLSQRAALVVVSLVAAPAFSALTETAGHAEPASETGANDAKAIYSQGKAAYDGARYEEALALFSRAYALRPAPALLFNMAQASRLSGKGHCAESLQLYERYLEREPAPENRAEVQERIVQMRACAADEERARAAFPVAGEQSSEAPPPAPKAAAPVSEPSPSKPPAPPKIPAPLEAEPAHHHSPPLAAVLTTGIGASLAIVGGILYLRARSKFEDAKATCPCPEGTYSDWDTLTKVSYGLMATGVVASGTGAAFWIFSGGSDTPDNKVSGAGLRFSGRF